MPCLTHGMPTLANLEFKYFDSLPVDARVRYVKLFIRFGNSFVIWCCPVRNYLIFRIQFFTPKIYPLKFFTSKKILKNDSKIAFPFLPTISYSHLFALPLQDLIFSARQSSHLTFSGFGYHSLPVLFSIFPYSKRSTMLSKIRWED